MCLQHVWNVHMSKYAAETWLITRQLCTSCKGPSVLSAISLLHISVSSTLDCVGNYLRKSFAWSKSCSSSNAFASQKAHHTSVPNALVAEPTRLNEFNRTCLYRSCCGHWFGICTSPAIIGKGPLQGWGLFTAKVSAQNVPTRLRQPIRCSCLNRESIVGVLVKAGQLLASNWQSVSISAYLGLSCEGTKQNSGAVFPLLTPMLHGLSLEATATWKPLRSALYRLDSYLRTGWKASLQDLWHVWGTK